MNKLVVLSLGTGDLHNGLLAITAQLWEADYPHPMKFTGSLPAAPALPQLYRDWQLLYCALQKAIARGLKLAIFNSCDGLGLAHDLADLHIGQVIVMREPVPDVVAQEFLRHFLRRAASASYSE